MSGTGTRVFALLFRALVRLAPPSGRGWASESLAVSLARLRDARARGRFAGLHFALAELLDAAGAVYRERRVWRRERRAASRAHNDATHSTGISIMDMVRDVLLAARGLRRRPLLSLGVMATLAFGIAVTTVMFGVVSTVLWRPLPFDHPERVYVIWAHMPQIDLGYPELPIHGTHFTRIRERSHTIDAVAAFKADVFNLEDGSAHERIDGLRTTGGLFRAIGVRPLLGRFFDEPEETPGRDHVVVLSYDLWRRQFGADPAIIGRAIRVSGEPYTVLGVAPQGFAFPRGGEMPKNFQMPKRTELWVPMAPAQRGPSDLALIARVRPSVTLPQLQADLDRISVLAGEETHAKGWWDTQAVALRQQVVGGTAPMLIVLFAAVLLVMLIACANAAQLLLASALARQREFAVRSALGARRGRLVRQVFVEALLLAALAGAAGALLSRAGADLVRAWGPERLPRLADIRVDPRVFIFGLLLTTLTGILFGVVPAVAGTRLEPWPRGFGRRRPAHLQSANLARVLRAGGRGATGGPGARLRQLFLVTEVALSLVLVAGAGLLLRSLDLQYRTDLGFQPAGTLTFEVTLPNVRYREAPGEPTYLVNPAVVGFISTALERLRELPGVQAASMAKPLPLSGAQEASVYLVEGHLPRTPDETPVAEYTVIGPDFFLAMGSALLEGREFTADDDSASAAVVIVNRAMASSVWPGEDPIGKRIKLPPPNRPWMTVVGVAPDIKEFSIAEKARPILFVPYRQRPYPPLATSTLLVRSAGDPRTLLDGVRREIAALDPELPLASIRTVSDLVDQATAEPRFATLLLSGFALAASMLAALGLGGLTAYLVTQRRRELGIRLALGATHRRLVSEVLFEGLRVTAAGVCIGLLVAVLSTRLLRTMLYGVSALDPVTFLLAPLVLTAAVAAACALPAWRAARVDPRTTLDAG